MHESELRAILRGEGRGDRRWPPGKAERIRWQQVAEFRRRVANDAAELFRWRVDLHVAANEGGAHGLRWGGGMSGEADTCAECADSVQKCENF
jgi:hypothetical protein